MLSLIFWAVLLMLDSQPA